MRFRLPLELKQTASLVVEEARPTQASFLLTNLTSQQVGEFVTQRSIDTKTEESLRRIVTQKEATAALESQKSDREEETGKIYDDQQRLRENIKALNGNTRRESISSKIHTAAK